MKLAMARCRRASAPRMTTKRAPESLAAVSKSSRPSASPRSKCCLGSKSKAGASPTVRRHTLALSSGPSGTSGPGVFGKPESSSSSSAETTRSAASALAMVSLRRATSAIWASASWPRPLASPIALEAVLRAVWSSWSSVWAWRRRASKFSTRAEAGSSPRRVRPVSKASGDSRIHLRSNMGTGRLGRGGGEFRPPLYGLAAPASTVHDKSWLR